MPHDSCNCLHSDQSGVNNAGSLRSRRSPSGVPASRIRKPHSETPTGWRSVDSGYRRARAIPVTAGLHTGVQTAERAAHAEKPQGGGDDNADRCVQIETRKKKRPLVLVTKQVLDFASSYAPPITPPPPTNYSEVLLQRSCTSD